MRTRSGAIELERKLAKSSISETYARSLGIQPGYNPAIYDWGNRNYFDVIAKCRDFYHKDGIAGTVVNRIAEITSTKIRNKRKSLMLNGSVSEREYQFFNAILNLVQPFIKEIIKSYLIDGMAIPQYELTRAQGDRLNLSLGRTRYYIPTDFWLRNPENIRIHKTVAGNKRRLVLKIPKDDITFVETRGMRSDGVMDRQAYEDLSNEFPEYVRAILDGAETFPLDDYVIYRNLTSYNLYPIPFLENALDPLEDKRYLRTLDRALASRVIESFRHFKVGNDEYPADDDDIKDIEGSINQDSSVERVYNLITHHAVSIEWVTPDISALLDDRKYSSINAEIFFSLGFPRILTVGETEKSNSADNQVAGLGIVATMNSIQEDVLEWVKFLYREIARANNIIRIPDPYFSKIQISDVTTLIQYIGSMLDNNVLSKSTAAGYYGSDYEDEYDQMVYEKSLNLESLDEGERDDS